MTALEPWRSPAVYNDVACPKRPLISGGGDFSCFFRRPWTQSAQARRQGKRGELCGLVGLLLMMGRRLLGRRVESVEILRRTRDLVRSETATGQRLPYPRPPFPVTSAMLTEDRRLGNFGICPQFKIEIRCAIT